MKELIIKHPDTQFLLAKVQEDYAEETKNRLEKNVITIICNKIIIKNEYNKRKRDVLS